jgi:hypothetical protein
MTQQEASALILDILVNDLHLKSGYPLSEQELKKRYRERRADCRDLQRGLEYAGDQEWLAYELETDMWFLTEAGHQAA